MVLVSASPSLREWVERLVSARNGEVAIAGQDRNCPAQAGVLQNVAEFVVRSVKALGAACCLQGEDPVLQGSALICWSGFCALWRCCWSPCEVAAGAAVSCWHSPSSVSLSGQAPSPPHQPVSLFPLLPVTPVLLLEPQLCLSLWLCYLLTTRMESSVSHRLN